MRESPRKQCTTYAQCGQQDFRAQDTGNQFSQAAGLIAVSRGFPGRRNVESVFDENGDDRPNSLREDHASPTRRAEDTCQVRKREYWQSVGAGLNTVQRDDVLEYSVPN